jgi:hypothetical protein
MFPSLGVKPRLDPADAARTINLSPPWLARDGVVGASATLEGRVSLSRGIVQLPGGIVVCKIHGLKSAALQSPTLLSLLIRHEQAVC